MKTSNKLFNFELFIYSLIAVLLASVILYLFYDHPVTYTYLISEDQFAEYGTSVSFGLAGLITLTVAITRGNGLRRIIWLLIALVSLLIAAEEISWGQRIFYVETPEAISKHNLQKELTLHNLAAFDTVNKQLHTIASYLILGYLAFSLLATTTLPRIEEKFNAIGLPLIKPRLIPFFLLPVYFLLAYPTAKSDEIGELFIGIAALMWAVDLYMAEHNHDRYTNTQTTLTITVSLLITAVITGGLTYWHDKDVTYRLNTLATQNYPELGMYEQAEEIYSYIYHNPRFLTGTTRLEHAKMLRSLGREDEANTLLVQATKDIEAKQPEKKQNSNQLRLLGTIHNQLSNDMLAQSYFKKSITIDELNLSTATEADKKAELLSSLAQTKHAQGVHNEAVSYIERALGLVESPTLRNKLEILQSEIEK